MISMDDELAEAVADAARGDRDALRTMMAIIRPQVVRYCRGRLGVGKSRHTADDVAQEVCMAVVGALPTYVDQGRPFMAFVYGIASHKVADAHRAMSRRMFDPDDVLIGMPDQAPGPEQVAVDAEAGKRVESLLQYLSPKAQEIIRLRVLMGMSAEETARIVGSSAGAVRVSQHRSLAKLRKLMIEEKGESL